MVGRRDYDQDKETLKSFLIEYCTQTPSGGKNFKYANQLSKLAHREQTSLIIDLDDVHDYNESVAESIINNAKRYLSMMSDLVFELLPNYKEREVPPKDTLDVYIEHRLMMEQRMHNPNEQRDANNKYPSELLRR